MADYYVQFSCLFDVGAAENATRAEAIRAELQAELERDEGAVLGFTMETERHYGPGVLWIYSDEYGEPEHVIGFVRRCAEAFDLQGLWGFTWSLGCSRPRLDTFGGGAHVIDLGKRQTHAWVDCAEWLMEHTAPPEPTPEAAL